MMNMTKRFAKQKKGQTMTTQPFIYLLGTIVMGVIFIFGYVSVQKFIKTGHEINTFKFKEDFTNEINDIMTEYGHSKINSFFVPNIYQKICLLDTTKRHQLNMNSFEEFSQYPLLWDSINPLGVPTKDNIFLIGKKSIYSFQVPPITIKYGQQQLPFLCIPNQGGQFKLKFIGYGDHTEIQTYNITTN